MKKFRMLSLLMVPGVLVNLAFVPAQAAGVRDYLGYGHPYRTDSGRYFTRHPYVQKAVIVGGTGAIVGAIASGEGQRLSGAAKGALIGAGVGVGYEYLRQKGIFSW